MVIRVMAFCSRREPISGHRHIRHSHGLTCAIVAACAYQRALGPTVRYDLSPRQPLVAAVDLCQHRPRPRRNLRCIVESSATCAAILRVQHRYGPQQGICRKSQLNLSAANTGHNHGRTPTRWTNMQRKTFWQTIIASHCKHRWL